MMMTTTTTINSSTPGVICWRCGSRANRSEARFCRQCGAVLGASSSSGGGASNSQLSFVNLTVLVVLSVVVAIVGVVWLVKTSNEKAIVSIPDSATPIANSSDNLATPAPAATAAADAAAQLAQADSLVAKGDASGAVEVLRALTQAEPTNAEAFRRLGEALELTENRTAAIEAYTAANKLAPADSLILQRLAVAQTNEHRLADAAVSFKTLLGLPEAATKLDETIRLRAADTFKNAGLYADASNLYQQLAVSKTATTRDFARRQNEALKVLLLASANAAPLSDESSIKQSSNAKLANANADLSVSENNDFPVVNTLKTNATDDDAPDEATQARRLRYGEAVKLWQTDKPRALKEFRALAATLAEANFYLGVGTLENKDLSALSRTELLTALQYFQLARNSSLRVPAANYEERLTAEYERRK